MYKKNKMIIVISVLIILLITFFIWYLNYYSLKFTAVEQFEINITNQESPIWFTLRDEKYGGFYSGDMLNNYGIQYDSFDFTNYTYIITVGHELKDIEYSYSNMKNRKILFIPKQFIGRVTLESKPTNLLYIYRIKKMDIDCDYHDPLNDIMYV